MKIVYILLFFCLNAFVFRLNSERGGYSFQTVLVAVAIVSAVLVVHSMSSSSLGLFPMALMWDLIQFSAAPLLLKQMMRLNIFALKALFGQTSESAVRVDKIKNSMAFISSWIIYSFIYLYQVVVILNDDYRDHLIEIISYS